MDTTHQARRQALAATTIALLALLVAGVGFELADALKAIPIEDVPGKGPTGGVFFIALPALCLLLGGFGCIYVARFDAHPPLAWLIAPLAGAFAFVHLYTWDDYCGGYGCRVTDEAPTGWHAVVPLAISGLLAGAITWFWPRIGLRATGVVAILCALSVFFVPMGH
jgi:hypothetical protein